MEREISLLVTCITMASVMIAEVRCQWPWGPFDTVLRSQILIQNATISPATSSPSSAIASPTAVLSAANTGTPTPTPTPLAQIPMPRATISPATSSPSSAMASPTAVLSAANTGTPTPTPTPLECVNFGLLNEPNRVRTYNKSLPVLCDTALSGWYRFSGEAGSQMANSCVQHKHCATDAPGWLSGGHPAVVDGVVRRKVCFRGKTNCCFRSIHITVRNCGNFYVYQLMRPPHCNFRYCGNGITPTSASPTPTTTGTPTMIPTSSAAATLTMPTPTVFSPFPTTSPPGCPKLRILNETYGRISSGLSIIPVRPSQTCIWQITARKGKRIKLVIFYTNIIWCKACSCGYLEIQNGSFVDGAPSGRICGHLLASVTYYSYLESLKLLFVIDGSTVGSRRFRAMYTQIDYNYNVSDECSNYRFLSESNRAVTYVNRSIANLRDSKLSGWYRFSGEAGSQMADSCPSVYHCGTDSPGWLSGTHPLVAEGAIQRRVCFSGFYGCCSSNRDIRVRNCGEFYVYKLDPPGYYLRYCGNGLPQAPECSNYTLLKEPSRARTYNNSLNDSCADAHLSGWYRFGGDAGSRMADTCFQTRHCGVTFPGWLSGGHPSVSDGAVLRKVCFNNYRGCCQWSTYISVRDCGGFYVYEFKRLRACGIGYCGNGLETPTTLKTAAATLTMPTPTVFSPFPTTSPPVPTTEPSTPNTTTTTIEPTTRRSSIDVRLEANRDLVISR